MSRFIDLGLTFYLIDVPEVEILRYAPTMTDYRLDGLSSRSFEHFVQALCVKVLTETITPFGDGPDGGREATFDGPTRYGADSGQWDGYGVVQAKFLQRPTDSTSNGKWVLKELKAELAKYKKRPSGRKMDYYILATNVALTPGADIGSKDKVFAELRQFAKKLGLKNVDVWDYDKLRIFLDNNEEVRRTYSAWVTPGDVLADLAEMLDSQRPDFYRLTVKFLQKEMLSDQFAKLEQAGHSADEAIPLSQVFVDVPVAIKPYSDPIENAANEDGVRYFADLIIREASLHCWEDDWRMKDEFPSRAIGRHVLIGGPGQGKTTVGQYICQVFRAALLAKVPITAVDHETRTIVRAIQRQWDNDSIAIPGARRIPFRVVLSEFAKSLADRQTSGLLEYLTSLFNVRTNANLTVLQFEALLAVYPSVLILDGLDEVPASTNRSQVLSAVKEFWADIATSKIRSSGIDILVVATSRPQGYNEDFSSKFYTHHWMVPLSPTQAIEYGEKLVEVRFSGDTGRIAKVKRRIRRAAENDATARLMRSPLQVTILTLLLDRMGQPPQERWPLFDEYFKLIYQREIERDIPAAAILREYKSNIVTVHRQVGLLLQVEVERSGGTDAKLTVEQFKEVVEHHLREEGHEGEKLAALTNSIIEAAANRLVFLVGLELGQVGFEIRSLQEFMAAEGLMAASDAITQDRLKAVAGNTNWRNVFLFAAGKCFFDRQYLRDTIHAVCGELNEDPEDKPARLTLAGSELALDVLEEGSARLQPRWNRMLTRTALRLLDDPSSEWSQRLAEVWQSETSDIFVSELRTRIEGGKAEPARNAWLCLVHLTVNPGAEFTDLCTDLLGTQQIDEDLFGYLLRSGNYASAPINSFLSDSVLNYPANIFVDSNDMYGHNLNQARREWNHPGAPSWLGPLAVFFRRRRWSRQKNQGIKILIGESLVARAPIPTIEESSGLAQELAFFPGGDHGWDGIKAHFDFLRSPNKETLANVLRKIGVGLGEKIQYRIALMSPWPLREAIYAARESNCLEELIDAAEAGLMGDIEDWLAWQKNWLDQGISLRELIEGDFLGKEIAGRPWCPVRIMLKDSHIGFGDLDEKFTAIDRLIVETMHVASSVPGRKLIAQLVGDAVIKYNYTLLPFDAARASILEVMFESSWILGLQCLLASAPDMLAERRWLKIIIDSISEEDIPHFLFGHDQNTSEAIQEAWLMNPDMKELLVFLMYMSDSIPERHGFIEKIANLDVSSDSRKVRIARMVILLRALYWDDTMATQIRELNADYPDALIFLIQAIDLNLRSPVEGDESICLHLYEIVNAQETLLRILIRMLRERMRSRRSSLTTAASWTRLGFPPELSQLIDPNV
ncbi:NACHT domain-containing protein [Streptosporangium sp. NPDC000095]|uniref:NACHT domain-containing protein n=1 Tax=Streptosporangium sp. NPDC000095 TaxID=3366184 RepID=UPI0036AF3A01